MRGFGEFLLRLGAKFESFLYSAKLFACTRIYLDKKLYLCRPKLVLQ